MQFVMHLSTKVLLGTWPPTTFASNLYILKHIENSSQELSKESEKNIFSTVNLTTLIHSCKLSRFVRIDNKHFSFLTVVWILSCMLFYPTTFEKPFTIWCPVVWKWGGDQRIRATMRFDTNWRPWNLPLADVDLCGILDEENPKNAWKMECQPLTIFAPPEEPMASMEPQLSLQCKLCRSWRAVLYLSQPTFISKLSPGKLLLCCPNFPRHKNRILLC